MSMVKRVTGRDLTSHVGTELTDLGIVRHDPDRNARAMVFGDSFSYSWGQDWRSPVILMFDDDFNCLGYPIKGGIGTGGIAPQAIPYNHNQGGISTILPCDMIRVRDMWFMAVMVVGMGGLGNEMRTTFWQSPDLVTWTKTDPYVRLDHPGGHPGDVMLTFDNGGDGYVYTFGTGGLARNKPIWLWRSKIEEFPWGHFEPWGMDNVGWAWGNPNEGTPILPGQYGELSFRFIQGNPVLSLFDVDRYSCSAITIPEVTGYWPGGNRVDYAHGHEFSQLYGGYICDDSRLSEPGGMKFSVSQWETSTNAVYHVIALEDTLDARGPLVEPAPEPEPEPIPEPEEPPVDPTTAQGTYELLLRELAASGSTEIVTSDGRKLTLREAVGEIHAQTCLYNDLKGQPRHPRESCAQLDHVRSARAEGLFTQAVVVELAEKAGIDVGALYAQVRRSIG